MVEGEENNMARVYGNPLPKFTRDNLKVLVLGLLLAKVDHVLTVSQINAHASTLWGGGVELHDELIKSIWKLVNDGYVELLGSQSIFENVTVRLTKRR